MPEWKIEIKKVAEDFCLSQVKVNRILKRIENTYQEKQIPNFYKGNKDEFLYDKAHTEIMNLVFA